MCSPGTSFSQFSFSPLAGFQLKSPGNLPCSIKNSLVFRPTGLQVGLFRTFGRRGSFSFEDYLSKELALQFLCLSRHNRWSIRRDVVASFKTSFKLFLSFLMMHFHIHFQMQQWRAESFFPPIF